MTAKMDVVMVPEGSVLVLQMEGEVTNELMDTIERIAGHRRFCILDLGTGATFEVWGPDTDLEAKVRERLARGEEETSG